MTDTEARIYPEPADEELAHLEITSGSCSSLCGLTYYRHFFTVHQFTAGTARRPEGVPWCACCLREARRYAVEIIAQAEAES